MVDPPNWSSDVIPGGAEELLRASDVRLREGRGREGEAKLLESAPFWSPSIAVTVLGLAADQPA